MNNIKIFLIIVLASLSACSQNNEKTINSWVLEKNTEISSAEVKKAPIYLDVREDSEWAEWHVEWAMHIKLSDILNGSRIDEIPKDTEVMVYCRSGNRSGQAIKYLEEKWFTKLINAWWLKDLKNVNIIKN